MKKILSILLVLILIISSFAVSYGGEAATEKPDIKIIIDGVRGTYSNTPIIVSGRTLLPLRELLVNLGVPNDDQHIIWNGAEKSVTVIKDATQLYLKVGSTSAKVNNSDAALDAAPVNYKGSVYIPARFVGEAFGKVVVWDGIAQRVYMKDKTEFNEIKNLLESSVAKMDGLKRYKENFNFSFNVMTDSGEDNSYSTETSGFTDNENKTVNWIMNFGTYQTNMYVTNHILYQKDTIDNEWSKEELTENDFNDYFEIQELGDVLYAALSIDKTAGNNLVTLEGNVSLDYFQNTDKTIQPDFDECKGEITIDNTTGYITKIYSYERFRETPDGEEPNTVEYIFNYEVSDFNGNFSTELPQELSDL